MTKMSTRLFLMKDQRMPIAIGLLFTLVWVLVACGSGGGATSSGTSLAATSPSSSGATHSPSAGDASFTDGVFATKDVKVQITRHKVIPVGQRGNEYGDKPVIAFWYRTTNLSGARVDSQLAWILNLDAYQGADSDAGNKLTFADPPDDALRYNQAKSIKKGGTIENAIAYKLNDLVTPVDVRATDSLNAVIGKVQYSVR